MIRYRLLVTCLALAASLGAGESLAQKRYDPGASDSEIRIGQTLPYSGPLSGLGVLGRVSTAYFKMLNETKGGVNGRKVNLLSLDDGYTPPKTLEMTRRLIERDEVLAIYNTLGTATNLTIHKYLNQEKVPHLFILSGAAKWNDPKDHPWTMMGMPAYRTEASVYARHILAATPNAKIAALIQNDDFGRDYFEGFRARLGDKAASMIIAQATYEHTDPTVKSQMVQLKASGADVFFAIALGKHASLALSNAHEIGWKVRTYLPIGAASVATVLRPAGVEASKGVITAAYAKSPGDPAWNDDAGMKDYYAFMAKWAPDINANDGFASAGYTYSQILTLILERCGNDLTRANLLRQAASLKGVTMPLYLPGITIDTGPNDYLPIQALALQEFDGASFRRIADPIGDE